MRFVQAARIWLLLLVSTGVQCRRNGAPQTACAQMVPGHGVPPQTNSSPFKTSLKMDLEERQVNVKLEAKESGSLTPFKGFLVMAFDVSSADTAAPIGSFVPVDVANMVDCSGRENSAATHKDNSPKETVELKWIPPQGFVGDVMFRTTFVQDRTTFWVQEPSSVIQLPQLPIQLPEAPIQAPEAPIPIQEAPIQVQEAPIPIQEAPIQVQEAPIPIQEAPIQIQEAPIQIQASPMEPAKVLEANVGSIAAQPMNLITICGIFSVCMAIRLLI